MARWVLEQLSDIRDYTDSEELTDRLHTTDSVSDVRLSPDGRHVHVILRQPQVGLVTFDKYEKPQLAQDQHRLSSRLTRTVPIVDVLYLEHRSGTAVVVAVIYENGKVEFWKFQECKPGWTLLQTSDLCNSPRARVVSVCVCSSLIIWCEERPPSESSSRNKLTYCVCRRDYSVLDGTVSLGGVTICLHNNPKFTLISSGEFVHLLPDVEITPVSKFFLSWSLRQDTFTVSTTCRNTPVKKLSAKESDFKKVVTDCLGYLSARRPPEICCFSPTACGGLLLLLSTGWLCLLQKDGVLRQVYKLHGHLLKQTTRTSFCLYKDVLALLMEQNLTLIDLNCGRELEKTVVKPGGVLYPHQCTPQLLSGAGVFLLLEKDTDFRTSNANMKSSIFSNVDVLQPGAHMVEAVFEEACKYYQQRSLSSTKLTVEALKKGGRFQAPISLASILREYLSTGSKQKEAHGSQNGEGGGRGCMVGQDKLMCSLETELKALVALEVVKGSLVRGGVDEMESMCERLVEQEVVRLLFSPELDEEALLYLNSIFSLFPPQAWRAAQAALQLHYNGKGCLSSKASPDVWKTVLSAPATVSTACRNGGLKPNHSLKIDVITKCKSKPNAPLPVFELLCQSIYHFQPSWLPQFLELAQQQQGLAGLGLSLVTSTWSFPRESGEHTVPLYKRALCILSSSKTDKEPQQDLEVELLLVSGRHNAILRALRMLISEQKWERVAQVAQSFCKQNPLLNKDIFTILLCEVTQHRDLDPYLDLLWALCPEDLTVTSILNLVLENLPSPSNPSLPSSFSMSSSSSSSSSSTAAPFSDSQLTIGLLKPLLRKVLLRETKPSQHYADILQSPSFSPPALPPRSVENPSSIEKTDPSLHKETPEHQTEKRVQRVRLVLPANPV
ncbi:Hermansky-Pudlak syndrome 6 protein [Gouania willdenowi]|uniref:Hermansky-Pudlak syndrome 6 protein n=1 Tax=Gouania willdenowi TaxID=441366 RepID=UPI001056B131|nr:Hermansky-Pudlak syndrome 6 protein [Gouania willdenowi]